MDFDKLLQKRGVLEVKALIEDTVISSNEAIRILYQLFKLLTKNETNFEPKSLLELIVLCSNNVSNLKEAEVNPFLMSNYHFMKYFFKHKMLDYVSILINVVEKHSLDANIKSDTYGYYVQLLARLVFSSSRDYDGRILQETTIFAMKCELYLMKPDIKAFCGRLISYPYLFRHSHINSVERNDFCLNFVRILRNIELTSEIQIDVYKSFLSVFYITVFNVSYCETEFPNYTQKTLEEIITVMYEVFKSKKINGCIEMLSLLFQSIIKDVKSFDKKSAVKLKMCNVKLSTPIRDQIFAVTCSQIGKMLKILVEYFGRVREDWNEFFPFEELLEMFELVERVVSENTFDVEKCCAKCNLRTDVFNSISCSAVSVDFLNVVIRKMGDVSNECHQSVLRVIGECCKHIKVLKGGGCEKYSSFWKYLGLHTYNIAVALYKSKRYATSKLYSEVFLRNMIAIEGTGKPNICFKDALGATFYLHASNLQNLQEGKEAMLYLVLTMVLSREFRKKSMWTWILVKTDDQMKAVTVSEVLLSREDELKQIVPEFKYDAKSAEELLIFELHYYSENWLSRIPIISCCNELLKLSSDVFVKTKALLLSYDKFLLMFDSQVIGSVQATIELINNQPVNFSHNICLALLKFILYQFKLYEMILKNLEDMNAAYIPLKSAPLQPYEEPPNPHDKCDIIPAFLNLNMDTLLNLYEMLDDCLKLWSGILDRKLTEPELLFLREYKVLKVIKATAFEFRLHHCQVQMINAWILYLKVAEILDDKLGVLEGIGFLLEYADCGEKEVVRLESVAEGIVKELDLQNKEHACCATTYYVNKSAGRLKNGLVADAYEQFHVAEGYFELGAAGSKICEARLLHLKAHFLLVPCTYEILHHEENVLITAQAAYLCIAEVYKTNSLKCSYTTSLLFEVSLWNGWVYKQLRLPREVRCYSKESVILAQKCLLPLRTAQFLSLLAFTDLLDRQYCDCQVKLSGLLKILCPSTSTCNSPQIPLISVTPSKDAAQAEVTCDLVFQAVLHVPAPEPQRITSSSELGSPILPKQPFVIPDFVRHSHLCTCYICRNYEYQKLIFDTVHLEALLNMHQGDRKQAETFFNGGILLHKKLQQKIQTSNPIHLLPSSKFIFTRLCRNISINYCEFLLDYAYFQMQKLDFQNASKTLDSITAKTEHLKCTNFAFWGEVVLQKTNIAMYKEKSLLDSKTKNENEDPELLVVLKTIVSTTPENKMSQKSIAVCKSPGIKVQPKKHVKRIQFDLSSENSDDNNQNENEKSPNEQYFKLKTPAKTPAPKIKIYTPKTVRQPKRTAGTSKVTETSVEPKVQTRLVAKKTLEERTKLLTGKLKASQKVPEDDLDKVAASVEKLSLSSRKKFNRIKQPNFSSSSLSSVDSPDSAKSKKVLGSRIKKGNMSTASSSNECGATSTRKTTRSRKQ